MSTDKLDFLVIGAAKSGTTSLFNYLSAHPDIYMPQAKEIGFFSSERDFPKGRQWYLDEWFAGAAPAHICGEASPQYMFESGVARRIRDFFPDVKLIAILRDPVARTFSHYRHSRRYGVVHVPTFADFLDQALGASSDEHARGYRAIVSYSQYGRILAEYFDIFPREQLRVMFFEDLQRDPQGAMAELFAWLGARGAIDSGAFQQAHNQGGAIRFPRLGPIARKVFDAAYQQEWLRQAVVRVFTRDRLRRWRWKIRGEFNIKKGGDSERLGQAERDRLRAFFADDIARLEALIGRSAPWPKA